MSKSWTAVKTKLSPGALHSHAACKLPSSMLVFGGERDGQPINELWRFHFGKTELSLFLIFVRNACDVVIFIYFKVKIIKEH